MAGLRLEAQDVAGLTSWRWVLTDGDGAFAADHEVRLDPACWQFEAFTDLLGYLSWHAAPDRRRADEARIVGELGTWIASEVFGPVAPALVAESPVTVRVVVPQGAEWLAFRPLELAHVDGQPLAVSGVTLVMEPAARPAGRKEPVGSDCGCWACSASRRAGSH